jgi:hypothetical protein
MWSTASYKYPYAGSRGITFIDVIVGVALALLIFTGLFGAFQLSIELIALSKGRSGALALANERMEYIRSLPYTHVGTQGGIPSGNIAQTEAIALNQTDYTRRTLILYVDDPADGLGGADQNGITTDYKQAKVEITWDHRGRTQTVYLVTNIVPRGIETTAGGGTIRVAVIDNNAQPVSGASVHVSNPGMVPVVDTTVYTNLAGEVLIGGAPAGSGFEVVVSKTGYSTAQTYSASTTNPNPSPAHLSVTAGNTTTGTFAIAPFAQKTIRTLAPIESDTFVDTFDDGALVAVQASTSISGGVLQLSDTLGVYEPTGSARSNNVTDAYLYRWDEVSFTSAVPAGTVATVSVYYDTGSGYARVPDSDLPGNAAGFTAAPIDLSTISTTTYPVLALGAQLTTTDVLASPSIESWTIAYRTGPTPIANVSFSMHGTKTIGTRSDSSLIYKVDTSAETDAQGLYTFSELEWDTYSLSITEAGYDVAEVCTPQPRAVNPSDVVTTNAFLVTPTASHTLLVAAYTTTGTAIPGATVSLVRSGYSANLTTGECGQSFFSPLIADDYEVTVSAAGYQTATGTVAVSGATDVLFNLVP